MILETLAVSIFGAMIGIIIAYILSKKGIKIQTKDRQEINKVINNPDLLLEKLNENGKMIDLGEEIRYDVVNNHGDKHIIVKKFTIEEKKEKKINKRPN